MITLLTIGHFKIALKKDEIELLRFLGATNFYIKKPYLKEGVFFGFVSAAIAFAIFAGILFYFHPFLSSYMRGVGNLYLNFGFYKLLVWPVNPLFLGIVFGLTALFGILISTLTTSWATEKYIK